MSACSVETLLQNAYVISLPGRSTRITMDGLQKHGIRSTIWPATSKDILDLERLRSASRPVLSRSGHANITVKAFATALSHRSLHDFLIFNHIPCALVAEDDTDTLRDFVPRLSSLMRAAPAEFDWIKLLHCSTLGRGPVPSVASLPPPARTLARAGAGNTCGGAAYVVSFAGARLLRAVQSPVWINADGAMDPQHVQTSTQQRPRSYYSEPPLAYHDELRRNQTSQSRVSSF